MDCAIDSTTHSRLLDLPPELRCEIYELYFALYTGEVKIRSNHEMASKIPTHRRDQKGPRRSQSTLIKQLEDSRLVLRLRKENFREPIGLLLVNRFIYHEALAFFMKSTTFRYTDVTATRDFMERHRKGLDNIRSVIVDHGENQFDFCTIHEILRYASRLPRLTALCIEISEGLRSTQLWDLQDSIVTWFLDHRIRADRIFVLHPAREKSYNELVDDISVACPAYPLPSDHDLLLAYRWMIPRELDGLTDQVRHRIAAHSGGLVNLETLSQTRGQLALDHVQRRRNLDFSPVLKQLFCGIVRTFVLRSGRA